MFEITPLEDEYVSDSHVRYHKREGDTDVSYFLIGEDESIFTLHRFVNAGGVPYSSIFEGNSEIFSAPRTHEKGMMEALKRYIENA